MGAGKIAAESCEFDYVASKSAVACLAGAVGHQLVEQILIDLGKGSVWRSIRRNTIQHRDPEDPPTEDA